MKEFFYQSYSAYDTYFAAYLCVVGSELVDISFKTHQESIAKRTGHKTVWVFKFLRVPVDAVKIVDAMKTWIDNSHTSTTEEHIKRDHIVFEEIHPFVDGNGRTGRMLMNWQRLDNNLNILTIWNKEKSAYYKWFK